MALSIRILPEDAGLVDQAAEVLQVTKSEFVRQSILSCARQVIESQADTTQAIDERWIGQGGGLRDPATVADPRRRQIVERLRGKHGYPG